jgi:hypothetical protein
MRAAALFALLLWVAPAAARAGGGEVELLTMGPGEELYARFGHTALRVRPAAADGEAVGGHEDLVYNFGTTDFEQRGLVWRFLRGTTVFWVKAQPYEGTLVHYGNEDRSIFRQRLNLSPAQHAELAALLRWNAEPRNREYRYHHFNDNCATRPRDLIDRVTGGAVRRELARSSGLRLRTLVHQGFAGRLGVLLLTDLLLGRTLDRTLSVWEAGFLPRVLMETLPTVHLPGGLELADDPQPVYLRAQPSPLRGDPDAGVRLLWWLALAVLALSALLALHARSRPRLAGAALLALALPLGLAGALVWGLAVVTPMPELRWNESLLLLWPTDLALIIVAVRWLRWRAKGSGEAAPRAERSDRRQRALAGRLLRAYAALRLAIPLAALVGHGAGWLIQQPLCFLTMSLCFAAGLLLACRNLPRISESRST